MIVGSSVAVVGGVVAALGPPVLEGKLKLLPISVSASMVAIPIMGHMILP